MIINVSFTGGRAHQSHKDPSDKQDVVTVGLLTTKGTSVGSIHVHLDGTWKYFPSRLGKQNGFAENIRKAGIMGFIAEKEEQAEAANDEAEGAGKGKKPAK